MGKTIHQIVHFKASPHDVYECLMDAEKHAAFSGSKCEMSRDVAGKFSCYDGWIEGENVKLEQDAKIVQKWRGDDWPEGHYSVAKFEFREKDGGTELEFTQTDVPDDKAKGIEQGWKDHYWDRMKEFLGE